MGADYHSTCMEADGECTTVPVSIQPESEQQCLLGMNALPALGLTLSRTNGEPLIVKEGSDYVVDHVVAHVRLVRASTVPILKGQFLRGS